MLTIIGNKVGGFGDTHIEDGYRGQHVNYQENCYWCMDKKVEIVEKSKPDFVFETGDWVGVRANVAVLRDNFMRYKTAEYLEGIKKQAPMVINTGNHDLFQLEDMNDYILHSMLGYFHTPRSIANTGEEIGVVKVVSPDLDDPETGKKMEMYIHFVPYGKEHVKLKPVKGATNVAVTHNDFRISSTSFTFNPEAIDLTVHEPFYGMDMIVNGHIHQPSQLETFTTQAGTESAFINLGCMARPARVEDYNMVWYLEFGFRKNQLTGTPESYVKPVEVQLRPASEIFREGTYKEDVHSDVVEATKQLELSNILGGLQDFNFSGVSISDRIELIDAEPEVKEIMYHYLGVSK